MMGGVRWFVLLVALYLLNSPSVSCSYSYYSISNSVYQVGVSVANGTIYLSTLSINRNITGVTGWTGNLLYDGPGEQRSGTGGLVGATTWVKSATNSTPTANTNTLSFNNISLPYAIESWNITIQEDILTWQVTRTFVDDVTLTADQSPVIFFNTTVGIPGFLDTDLFLDSKTNAGFPLASLYYEFLSPNLNQQVRLTPFNMRFVSEIKTTSGFFTFGKLAYDGTSPFISLGVESIDRRNQVKVFTKGQKITTTWTLQIIPDLGVPYGPIYGPEDLVLNIPRDSEVESLSKKLIPVHNNFMGWAFGNNPASVICLHEMSFFPMMQGVLSFNPERTQAIQNELDFLFSQGVNGSGYVMPRWNSAGFYYVQWGPLHDQIPHAILAAYFHAMNTGNKAWLEKVLPTIELIGKYLISLDIDGDGVPEVPGASGLSDGGKHTSNWYDIIEFGHKDAYIAAYSCMALQALAEMKSWTGDNATAEYYQKIHSYWVMGFNKIFWNETLGYYMDWIDVQGGKHSYFYVDQNLLAIIYGIANKTQAQSILSNLDLQYANLVNEFNVSRTRDLWATPANMVPITIKGDMVFNGTLQNQTYYPMYENGGSFFHSPGFEIAARAVAGEIEEAYQVYKNLLVNGQNVGDGFMWSALLKWDNQELYGEPLTGAMMTTWGLIRGCFGVWPSLTKGLVYSGSYSSALEGASASFQFLGQNVTITARNNTVEFS